MKWSIRALHSVLIQTSYQRHLFHFPFGRHRPITSRWWWWWWWPNDCHCHWYVENLHRRRRRRVCEAETGTEGTFVNRVWTIERHCCYIRPRRWRWRWRSTPNRNWPGADQKDTTHTDTHTHTHLPYLPVHSMCSMQHSVLARNGHLMVETKLEETFLSNCL